MATHNITSFAYRAPLRYSFSVANFPYAPKIPLAISGVYPAAGSTAGGTSVYISGQSFIGATDVLFGITSATSFNILDQGLIEAVSPAGDLGTVDITVVHADGNVTKVNAFVYSDSAPNAPYIINFTSTSATTITVVFNRAVRQVDAGNSDDALNPANYIIPTLTVSGVESLAANSVQLTTSTQANIEYNYTVQNIKDLEGNLIIQAPV